MQDGCSVTPTVPLLPLVFLPPVAQAHPNSIALFVPAEITTYCFYPGKVKDYLVANAIFRMGGAAVLMTNKPALIKKSKYQLMHSVRIHTGQDDAAYRWVCSWCVRASGLLCWSAMSLRNRAALSLSLSLHQGVRQYLGSVLTSVVLSCRCISWGPDPDGVNGVFLGKDVPLQVRKKVPKELMPACNRYLQAPCDWQRARKQQVAQEGALYVQLMDTHLA
jgi:hypothetical protein